MVKVVAVDTGTSVEDQRTEVLTLIGFLSYFAPTRDGFLEKINPARINLARAKT